MRTVFMGDSHLARLRRALTAFSGAVHNAAAGGATSRHLLEQAAAAGLRESDVVVLSVGTNDAAPWQHVPVTEFARLVSMCLTSHPPRGWVYVAPPGVDERRLSGEGDRTNSVIDEYRLAAIVACEEASVPVVRADLVLEQLGAEAFAADGLHLSGAGYRVLVPAIASCVDRLRC